MSETDYFLGTHDAELERLGLQHAVWRARALDAWRRGGFTRGQTLIDLGAGPGYAALDLADVVGREGRVIALERSERFADALKLSAKSRAAPIDVHQLDVEKDTLPIADAHGAWARWIFAFLQKPRDVLAKLITSVRPGGVIILHEYWDYRAWSLSPRAPAFERFVDQLIFSWRRSGGEADIGRDLPRWLQELGCEVREIRAITDIVPASNFVWNWPAAFLQVNLDRLVELGELDSATADQIRAELATAQANPLSLMSTPIVAEIIAVKRSL